MRADRLINIYTRSLWSDSFPMSSSHYRLRSRPMCIDNSYRHSTWHALSLISAWLNPLNFTALRWNKVMLKKFSLCSTLTHCRNIKYKTWLQVYYTYVFYVVGYLYLSKNISLQYAYLWNFICVCAGHRDIIYRSLRVFMIHVAVVYVGRTLSLSVLQLYANRIDTCSAEAIHTCFGL